MTSMTRATSLLRLSAWPRGAVVNPSKTMLDAPGVDGWLSWAIGGYCWL
jgi:hypothetical protein